MDKRPVPTVSIVRRFHTIEQSSIASSRFVAVTHGRQVQVWRAPGHTKDFSPFSLYRSYPGQYDGTLCLDWSEDSRWIMCVVCDYCESGVVC